MRASGCRFAGPSASARCCVHKAREGHSNGGALVRSARETVSQVHKSQIISGIGGLHSSWTTTHVVVVVVAVAAAAAVVVAHFHTQDTSLWTDAQTNAHTRSVAAGPGMSRALDRASELSLTHWQRLRPKSRSARATPNSASRKAGQTHIQTGKQTLAASRDGTALGFKKHRQSVATTATTTAAAAATATAAGATGRRKAAAARGGGAPVGGGATAAAAAAH